MNRFLSAAALAAAAAALASGPAQAHYTSSITSGTVTMSGDSASDQLVMGQQGGLLKHNRYPIDPGFNSSFDFNTLVAGDQTISATDGSQVNVNGGAGDDTFTAGSAADPASNTSDQFQFVGGNDSDTLVVDDSADPIGRLLYFSAGIVNFNPGAIWSYSEDETVAVRLGTGGDTLNVQSTPLNTTATVETGAGDDTITVGNFGVNLSSIISDVAIDGGAGTDPIVFGDSAPSGRHTYRIAGQTVTRDEGGAASFTGVESATLNTSAGQDNVFKTGSYPFTINTANGADYVATTDSVADTVDCGTANDLVFADLLDSIASNCESVSRIDTSPPQPAPQPQPQPQAPAPDTEAPGVQVAVAETVKRKVLLKGLKVTVTPDEASALDVEERASAKGATLAAANYNLTLARATKPLGAGARTLILKASRRLVGRKRRFSVRILVTATDAAGNRTTVTRTVKVRG